VAAWSAVAATARSARTGAAGTRRLIGGDPIRRSGCHPQAVTLRAPIGRRAVPVALMAVGAALAIIGALLPWIRTGGRSRNSFDLFRIVRELGFAPDGAAAALIRGWPIVPLLAVVGVVAAWWGWARPGGAIGVVAAVYAGAVGAAILAAPTRGRVLARAIGPTVTTIGGAVLLGGSIAVLVVGRAVRRPTATGGPARPSGAPGGPS